jgi:hypothetical protein
MGTLFFVMRVAGEIATIIVGTTIIVLLLREQRSLNGFIKSSENVIAALHDLRRRANEVEERLKRIERDQLRRVLGIMEGVNDDHGDDGRPAA